jgi:hypothetical protein
MPRRPLPEPNSFVMPPAPTVSYPSVGGGSIDTGADSLAAGIRQLGAGIERGRAEARQEREAAALERYRSGQLRLQEMQLQHQQRQQDYAIAGAMLDLSKSPDLSPAMKRIHIVQFARQMGIPTDSKQFKEFADGVVATDADQLMDWARTMIAAQSRSFGMEPGIATDLFRSLAEGKLSWNQFSKGMDTLRSQMEAARKPPEIRDLPGGDFEGQTAPHQFNPQTQRWEPVQTSPAQPHVQPQSSPAQPQSFAPEQQTQAAQPSAQPQSGLQPQSNAITGIESGGVKRLAIMTPHRRPILTPHFGEAFAL